MASLAVPTQAPMRTPGRSSRSRRTESAEAVTEAATEPANKRRKFTPSRPARFAVDESSQHVNGHMNTALTAPRRRAGRIDMSAEAKLEEEQGGETPTVTRSALHSRPRRERSERERFVPAAPTPRPRYSSAAAAAAASQASDGYKPREEKSWEEYHPELDVDMGLFVFNADEVDGRARRESKPDPGEEGAMDEAKPAANGDVEMRGGSMEHAPLIDSDLSEIIVTPMKRKPGRPPRRQESMLHGLGSPPAPKIIPLPTHNPKERLNLPKPSFRSYNHFLQFEEDQQENRVNYVDRTMASLGYEESDRYELLPLSLVRLTECGQVEDEGEVSLRLESDGTMLGPQPTPVVGRVEYDMDEQDVAWLEDINGQRKIEGVDAIKPAILEITMTQIEKEYHALEKRIPKPQPRHAQTHRPRSSSQAAVNGDHNPPGDEPDSKCSICDDGDCENANAIIFCDGCDLAVHQECYGVPFIPEGQWFCRKCKEIGRGTPTCIFCPNVDGAFKQTNTLRWSHLLCAIWIPEVTIANMTFMEPVTDVEKVPKSRWKLQCYICNQKMGACIQCGNKNCYAAFHVTCARKAKLFLKMKTQHQQGLDTTALKAFCDKHVPPEWRRTHDTDNAIVDAKRWYRHAMKDRKWADNQSAALELGAAPPADGGLVGDHISEDTIAVSKKRFNQNQAPKVTWRLPSGAPVVPAVVYNTVEASLARFPIRKRKDFVEKVCKYWTLKREARRGAALLKRLQVQLETFSSMEITRRNFAGMGSAGRPRLLRRIEFAEMLQQDMGHLTRLCSQTREREELRLREVELLKELVDTVYFPITALLRPILQRARKLDEKTRVFSAKFDQLALLLHERFYTSVEHFWKDIQAAIYHQLSANNLPNMAASTSDPTDLDAIQSRLNDIKPGTAEHSALTNEQKEQKRLAKRILKATKELIEDALRKESALTGRELEAEMRKLDSMGIFAQNDKLLDGVDATPRAGSDKRRPGSDISAAAGASPGESGRDEHADATMEDVAEPSPLKARALPSRPNLPLSPPVSTENTAHDPSDVFAAGGVPWYLSAFDPEGTTVHEERYTGREALRDLSEELSEVDEDTLGDLAPEEGVDDDIGGVNVVEGADAAREAESVAKKRPKRRGRKNMWSRTRR